jgi:hypothetical protein
MGLLREGDPARYHLATTPDGIEVAVHKKAILAPADINKRDVEFFKRCYGMPQSFTFPSADREWGFEAVLSQQESPNPDWLLYTCDLPKATAGKLNPKLLATSATLSILFDGLSHEDCATDASRFQYQSVSRMDAMLGGSFELIVHLNPPLLDWLQKNMSESLSDTVVDAMFKSFRKMNKSRYPMPKQDYYMEWQEPGLLFTRVPGTTLNAYREEYRKGLGYDMSTNNSDLPQQQLALLVGLARIEEMATGKYFRKVPGE